MLLAPVMMNRVVACALLVACGEVKEPAIDAMSVDEDAATGGLEFTRAEFAFGNVGLGSASAIEVFELRARSDSPAFTVRLSGEAADQFVIVDSSCGSSLPRDARCEVRVAMAPTSVGDHAAQLVAEETSSATLLASLMLTGTGVMSAVSLTPSIQSFGDVTLGTSMDRAFTVNNTGTASFAAPTFDVADAAFSVLSNDCASALAPGDSCSAIVRFSPAAPGARSSSLVARVNGAMAMAQLAGSGGSTLTIARTGPGTVVGPGIDCGVDCETRTTSTPVQVQAIAASGALFVGWGAAASACGTTVTCNVPIAAGAVTANASFADIPTLRLTVQNADPAGPSIALGSVTVSPPNEICGGEGMATQTCTYDLVGAVVNLTAMNECSSFVRWVGACSGSSPSCSVNLTADMTVTAIFDFATCQ